MLVDGLRQAVQQYVTVVSAAVDINCMVLFNNITRQTNMRVNLFQGLGSAKD